MQIPRRTPSRESTARDLGAGPEEASLVEEAVVGQVRLAVDVAELAVLEQRGGDVQLMVVVTPRRSRRRPTSRPRPLPSSRSRGSSARIATSELRSWSR